MKPFFRQLTQGIGLKQLFQNGIQLANTLLRLLGLTQHLLCLLVLLDRGCLVHLFGKSSLIVNHIPADTLYRLQQHFTDRLIGNSMAAASVAVAVCRALEVVIGCTTSLLCFPPMIVQQSTTLGTVQLADQRIGCADAVGPASD